MPWLTILKLIIPYIWDVFIKQYDEDGNPVLWSKPMIIGVIVVICFLYYNMYSFIHTKTEEEHILNVKNSKLINDLKTSNEELKTQLVLLLKERDESRSVELRTKATLSEARLDIIQLTEKLNECGNVITTNDGILKNNGNDKKTKNKNMEDIDLILRGDL